VAGRSETEQFFENQGFRQFNRPKHFNLGNKLGVAFSALPFPVCPPTNR